VSRIAKIVARYQKGKPALVLEWYVALRDRYDVNAVLILINQECIDHRMYKGSRVYCGLDYELVARLNKVINDRANGLHKPQGHKDHLVHQKGTKYPSVISNLRACLSLFAGAYVSSGTLSGVWNKK